MVLGGKKGACPVSAQRWVKGESIGRVKVLLKGSEKKWGQGLR